MTTIAPEGFGNPEKYVLLSDGAFDEARGAGIAEVSLDPSVLKGAVEELDVCLSHLPTLAVIELIDDGSCKNPRYRETYKDADPLTFVTGASLGEDAPPIISRIGEYADKLNCQTLSFITIGSLLDPTDHYIALLEGLAAVQHTETLRHKEEKLFRAHEILRQIVRVEPIYRPHDDFSQHAAEVIRESQNKVSNPSPFVITYR